MISTWSIHCISSVQFISVTQSCPTLRSPMDCSTPGFPILHYLPESVQFINIESVIPSNHLILCRPLLLLLSILRSIRVFFNELALHIRGPKYWNFSFSISLSKEYSGLISFRMDWFDPSAWIILLKYVPFHLPLSP